MHQKARCCTADLTICPKASKKCPFNSFLFKIVKQSPLSQKILANALIKLKLMLGDRLWRINHAESNDRL